MPKRSATFMPRLYLFLCVIFWGWTFVATKIALNYVTPIELIGLRFLIGLPIMVLVLAAKGIKLEFTKRDYRPLILGSAVLTVHFIIQVTGLQYTSATNTGWIISVTPLVMALAGFVFLKEKIGRFTVFGIFLATSGILLLVSKGNLGSLGWIGSKGDWLVLISAHTWVLYTVAIRRISSSRNPLAVTLAVMIPSALGIIGYMLFSSDWSDFLTIPTNGILALLFLAIFGTALAHWFWQEGVAGLGATQAGIFLYIEPIATTALAIPMLGEEFGMYSAIGAILVMAGVFTAQKRKQEKHDKKVTKAE